MQGGPDGQNMPDIVADDARAALPRLLLLTECLCLHTPIPLEIFSQSSDFKKTCTWEPGSHAWTLQSRAST